MRANLKAQPLDDLCLNIERGEGLEVFINEGGRLWAAILLYQRKGFC
jgi:hypothetical protein